MSWPQATVKGLGFTVFIVVGTVWLPSKVLGLSVLNDAPGPVREVAATAVWGLLFFGGLWWLWRAQRKGWI